MGTPYRLLYVFNLLAHALSHVKLDFAPTLPIYNHFTSTTFAGWSCQDNSWHHQWHSSFRVPFMFSLSHFIFPTPTFGKREHKWLYLLKFMPRFPTSLLYSRPVSTCFQRFPSRTHYCIVLRFILFFNLFSVPGDFALSVLEPCLALHYTERTNNNLLKKKKTQIKFLQYKLKFNFFQGASPDSTYWLFYKIIISIIIYILLATL